MPADFEKWTCMPVCSEHLRKADQAPDILENQILDRQILREFLTRHLLRIVGNQPRKVAEEFSRDSDISGQKSFDGRSIADIADFSGVSKHHRPLSLTA